MTETSKTMVFVTAAVIALLAAFVITPSGEEFKVEELVGQKLNKFEINAPKKLKIIRFDKDTGTSNEFEVAEKDNLWVIPSKQDYPADADKQMGDAAASVANLPILRIAAEKAGSHADLGVVSPSNSNLTSKTEGVGTRVVMTDSSGDSLVDMIVGNQVKDASDQRYVRNTDQDVVYVTKLDPKGLSTKFDDWIEGDLLGLSPFDIRTVHINDYTAELIMTLGGTDVKWDRRGKFALQYNNTDSKWIPESLQQFDPQTQTYVDQPLAENQEINSDSLKELKDALDDLTIVDVERKPEGLSADLKAGADFLKNNEAILSLITKGFAPVALSAGAKSEILSSQGELICTLNNGVEYVLRFGNLKIGDGSEEKGAEDAADSSADTSSSDAPAGQEIPDGEEKSPDQGIHRYLFVTTKFNESIIERPQTEELPALPEGASEDSPAETPAEKITEDDQKAQENSSDADQTAEQAAAGSDAPATEDAAKAEEPSAASPEDPSEDPSDWAADTGAAGDQPADAADGQKKSDELEKIIAERKRIRAENERKEDEYKNKLDEGRKKVEELNERFGNWYYVISNDLYNKIHLGRAQLVKEKEKEEEEEGKDNAAGAISGGANASPLSGLPNLPVDEAATATPPAEEPATEQPATDATEAEATAAEEPATEEQAAAEVPAADAPTTEPAAEVPAAEEPAADAPATEQPAEEQPKSDGE
jgi:uncharacterized protein DUF4340